MSRWPAILVLITAVVTSSTSTHADHTTYFSYSSPVTELAQYEFTPGETLGVVSGAWTTSGGTFNSTSTATSIATINGYRPEERDFPDIPEIVADKFWYRARMLNELGGSTTRVGILYLYKDRSNYSEASFSPTGSVFVREVTNGVATTVATGTYVGGGQNKWFDAEVQWTAAETVIRVNGVIVVRGIKQTTRKQGRVGLITRQTTAKFDRLLATREYGDPEFREPFTREPAWNELKGNWSAVNGAYQNSAVEHASITLLPIDVGFDFQPQTERFSLYARMLNPYGGSGNRLGFLFGYERRDAETVGYREVVFGPDGIARVNVVLTSLAPGGTTQVFTEATAPYPGKRGEWFDAELQGYAQGSFGSLKVNGVTVFPDLSMENGLLGLVTHWTPGRFDDVWFNYEGQLSVFENFDFPRDPPTWWAVRGTWDQTGGTLNNRTAGATDLATVGGYQRSTDYTLSARMQNLYSGTGNRVGLVFNFDFLSGDYYEVLFAPTGEAYLNKFIQGQLTRVATSTHTALGRAVWFDVELARRGPLSTVKVNGQTVFQNIATGQLDNTLKTGEIGFITHWARANFDDLRFEDYVPR